MTPRNKKITFVVPFFKGDYVFVIDRLFALFRGSEIILINDNPITHIKYAKKKLRIINNTENLGLGRCLVLGYERALADGSDYIIKIDPDFEYPPEAVKFMIEALDNGSDGVFVGFKRRFTKVTFADFLFNNIFAFLEGVYVENKMIQHSPGLQAYKKEALSSFIEKFKNIVSELNLRWGADLLAIRLAKNIGCKTKGIEIENNEYCCKRENSKIYKQAKSAFKIMIFHNKIGVFER